MPGFLLPHFFVGWKASCHSFLTYFRCLTQRIWWSYATSAFTVASLVNHIDSRDCSIAIMELQVSKLMVTSSITDWVRISSVDLLFLVFVRTKGANGRDSTWTPESYLGVKEFRNFRPLWRPTKGAAWKLEKDLQTTHSWCQLMLHILAMQKVINRV